MKLSCLPMLAAVFAFTPGIASAATISSASQLTAALKTAKGGEVFDLAPGNYGKLTIASRSFSSPVTFRSTDPSRPAVFGQTNITGSKNIRFDGVEFSNPLAAGQPEWTAAVWLAGSSAISFNNVKVHGSLDNNSSNDGYGIHSRSSSGVTITNSNFTQLYRAVLVESNQNVTLTGNVIKNIRSEGFNFADVQGVKATGNSFSEFHPILPGDHPDAIQFWTQGTSRSSSNILITNNLIVGSAGGRMQGVFMGNSSGAPAYKNVTISDNTLVGTMWHAIDVMQGSGVAITGNNVVTEPDNVFKTAWIRVSDVQGTISGNTAKEIHVIDSPGVTLSNNKVNTTSTALAQSAIQAWSDAHKLPVPTTPTGNSNTGMFASNLPTPQTQAPVPTTNTAFDATPLNNAATAPAPVSNTAFDQRVQTGAANQNSPDQTVNVLSAVPEPATWLQLICGFGLVGWLARRARRSPPTAIA